MYHLWNQRFCQFWPLLFSWDVSCLSMNKMCFFDLHRCYFFSLYFIAISQRMNWKQSRTRVVVSTSHTLNNVTLNLIRSDLPWQAEEISANVSRFLQDSCKMHLCSRFFFLEALFSFFVDISLVVTSNLILLFEVKILFEIGNIYRNYIVV